MGCRKLGLAALVCFASGGLLLKRSSTLLRVELSGRLLQGSNKVPKKLRNCEIPTPIDPVSPITSSFHHFRCNHNQLMHITIIIKSCGLFDIVQSCD
jgi:hypothetical protein